MVKLTYRLFLVGFMVLFISACANTSNSTGSLSFDDNSETLYIYEDGRMLYKTRFLNPDDVVIYDAGFNGERAAVKVYYPVRADFYRDSIEVVRVEDRKDEAISVNQEILQQIN